MSSENWPWDGLGLAEETSDKREIKRAYARKLKSINQATDIEAFTKLREAYDYALSICEEEGKEDEYYHASLTSSLDEPLKPEDSESVEQPLTEKVADKDTVASTSEAAGTDDNWDRLHSLSARLHGLVSGDQANYDVESWRIIIEDPAVMSFAARQYIEEQLVGVIHEAISNKGESSQPAAPDTMTPEFVALIDSHFSWVSDGVSFVKQYGHDAEQILSAITADHLRFREKRNGLQGDALVVLPEPMPFLLRWYVIFGIYVIYRLTVMS